ncbi:MAG: 23S rRNA (pseudouridine(1915)-N(3))-methyltransferase RlmH [Candidatus Azotimanducaceae bacterium]|uniref:Ribosomal RNA large subunit methyltransferase H n=1 Tax=OM182 bacterium TaxID=2510334 RepID=A0A520S1Z8_9GAMM|nr:23S rRNA (pseudouridine(1915)-N(3))-methyltransferase RlmH [Gammaproteobacteria bacterium]OUV67059.1 MAG: 23S rRNA (pseudouridine(1915)-N(3))-methyltransferase RlmH [Gammaproteobacteria bacterium TMED133]RZO76492.1 MAG: 23S rRNA (pseudouridine(1915)-N(3))-methyltransferase RlmH [OM182 bacterium]
MKLEVVTVGNRPPSWLRDGLDEYRRRIPREWGLSLREIPLPKRTKGALTQALVRTEFEKIRSISVPHSRKVVMATTGKIWSSEDLTSHLRNWLKDYQMVQFFVGGPDGLDKALLDSADDIWSLSRLTFPHAFVPVLILEQIYRAWTMIKHHPYHR